MPKPPLYKPPKDPTKRKPLRQLRAVAVEDHIITYECQTCFKQHRFALVNPGGKPIGSSGVAFMARWHSGKNTKGTCPFCCRQYLKTGV